MGKWLDATQLEGVAPIKEDAPGGPIDVPEELPVESAVSIQEEIPSNLTHAPEGSPQFGRWSRMIAEESSRQVENLQQNMGIDIETGGNLLDRVVVGLKLSNESKLNYMRGKYGRENARINVEGELEFKPTGADKWIRFDEYGATLKDIGDISGALIEAIPPTIYGAVSADPVGAGLAASIGSGLRQELAKRTPGGEDISFGGGVGRVGESFLVGAVGQKVVNELFKIPKKAIRNIFARYIWPRSKSATRAIRKAEKLTLQTGIPLTPAQQSGSRSAILLENLVRQHPATADIVSKTDIKQLQALRRYIFATFDTIAPGREGKAAAGEKIAQAYKTYVTRMIHTRSVAGKLAFDRANVKAAGREVVSMENTISSIDDVIKKFKTPVGDDPATLAVRRLEKIKNRLIKKTPTTFSQILDSAGRPYTTVGTTTRKKLTIKELQRGLSIYGKRARGAGKIVPDLSTAENIHIAQQIYDGLLADLDNTVQLGGLGGIELKTARDLWAAMSNEIDDLTKSVLIKIIDKPGEKAVDSFLSSAWTHSEVKTALSVLRTSNLAAVKNIRVAALEEILGKAVPPGTAYRIGGVPISPAKFVTQANHYDDRIKALFVGDRAGYVTWRRGVKAAQRIADRGGLGGSQTAPMQWTMGFVKTLIGHARGLNPVGMATDIATFFAPQHLARIIMHPQAKKQLLIITAKGSTAKAVSIAIMRIKEIEARENWIQEFKEREAVVE